MEPLRDILPAERVVSTACCTDSYLILLWICGGEESRQWSISRSPDERRWPIIFSDETRLKYWWRMRGTISYRLRVNRFYAPPADDSSRAHDLYMHMHVNHCRETSWAHDRYTILQYYYYRFRRKWDEVNKKWVKNKQKTCA